MGRLIDADDFVEWLLADAITDEQRQFAEKVRYAAERMKPVDAVPVRRGKWLREDRDHVEYSAVCDQCGYDTFWCERSNYCPDCGARMDGKDGDDGKAD